MSRAIQPNARRVKVASKKTAKKKTRKKVRRKKVQPRATVPAATRARQKAFLAVYSETANIRASARAAKISRRTHYDWMEKDARYRTTFEAAGDDATDFLEREAVRRGAEGLRRYKFTGKGEKVMWLNPHTGVEEHYYEVEYSDLLLRFMLQARRPDVYRERREVTGVGGGPVEHTMKLKVEFDNARAGG